MKIKQLLKIRRVFGLTSGEVLFFSAWLLLFVFIWRRMLFFEGGYYFTNARNIWGDWSLHFVYIYNFLYRQFPLAFFPIYWGSPFRYHFTADFLTALLMKAHLPLVTAVVLQSVSLSFALVVTSYLFYKQLFKNISVAMVAVVLFLFNGGLGFLWSLYDWYTQKGQFVLPDELTNLTHIGIRWINVITAEFIPQRAFLLGMPITVGILVIFWKYFENDFRNLPRKQLFTLGLVTGFLPIIHYHSFFVVLVVAAYLMFLTFIGRRNTLSWAWFLAPLIVVAFFLHRTFIGSAPVTEYIRFHVGWEGPSDLLGFIWFWIKNMGFMSLIIPLSYFFLPRKVKVFGVPFVILFIISNLIIFQDQPWDNRKFLVYWYFFSTGSVAYFLIQLVKTKPWAASVLIIGIFYTSLISGVLDVIRLPYQKNQLYQLFSVKHLEFAQRVRNLTDQESVFLTTPANSWLGMVIGRQVVMGFDLWLPNYGLPVEERRNDIQTIYRGEEQAENLLSRYSVDYVIVGPQERGNPNLNEAYFKTRYPVLIENNETTIYDVGSSNKESQ